MVTSAKTIDIASDSETARLLHEADETPVVMVVNGNRYRVHRERTGESAQVDDVRATSDSGYEKSGMLAAAGRWKDVDTEALKADIRRWREEGSRGGDRP